MKASLVPLLDQLSGRSAGRRPPSDRNSTTGRPAASCVEMEGCVSTSLSLSSLPLELNCKRPVSCGECHQLKQENTALKRENWRFLTNLKSQAQALESLGRVLSQKEQIYQGQTQKVSRLTAEGVELRARLYELEQSQQQWAAQLGLKEQRIEELQWMKKDLEQICHQLLAKAMWTEQERKGAVSPEQLLWARQQLERAEFRIASLQQQAKLLQAENRQISSGKQIAERELEAIAKANEESIIVYRSKPSIEFQHRLLYQQQASALRDQIRQLKISLQKQRADARELQCRVSCLSNTLEGEQSRNALLALQLRHYQRPRQSAESEFDGFEAVDDEDDRVISICY